MRGPRRRGFRLRDATHVSASLLTCPPARPPTRPPALADFEKEGNIGDRGALLAMAVDAGMKEATAKALLEGAEAPIARQLVLKKERAREWPDLSQP